MQSHPNQSVTWFDRIAKDYESRLGLDKDRGYLNIMGCGDDNKLSAIHDNSGSSLNAKLFQHV